MPRVFVTTTEKKKFQFKQFVYGRIQVLGTSQTKIADAIGMKQQTFNYKLRTMSFDFGELVELFKELQVTEEEISYLMLER